MLQAHFEIKRGHFERVDPQCLATSPAQLLRTLEANLKSDVEKWFHRVQNCFRDFCTHVELKRKYERLVADNVLIDNLNSGANMKWPFLTCTS
ncbi:hypothetical protein N9L68_00435 [bacterium]|nr:hypothetical protein [bacterium]